MRPHNRREWWGFGARLALALRVTSAFALIAACSSQDSKINTGTGGSGFGGAWIRSGDGEIGGSGAGGSAGTGGTGPGLIDASADTQPYICGDAGHACASDEICYLTTEGGGLVYSCIKVAPLCGAQTPGCSCPSLRNLCLHGGGECFDEQAGQLVFCTSEGTPGGG